MQRSHLNAAVLFIDLDNFKVINDSKGHAVGDKLLIEASKRLCEAVREFDTVARLGGDEFVVLLTELDGNNKKAFNQALIIGNKILSSLADRYVIEDLTLTCSASIGIAVFNGFDTTDDILKHADMAMYQAKRKGRNSICFFDLELKRIVTDYANLEQSLSRALELNQLEIYFQPIVTTEGVITRAEVLLRWNHPTRGLISPIDFIGIAEESGLVVPIGIWVIEKTCEQLSQWKNIP
jgi:diguanylate cyclase (GGDEF)-like protein